MGKYSKIPQHLQIPDIGPKIDKYFPEIVNWAPYAPPELLKVHINGELYREMLKYENRGETASKGIPLFLIEQCCYSLNDPKSFESAENLVQAFKSYSESKIDNSIDSILDLISVKKNGNKSFCNFLIKTAKEFFGTDLTYDRSPKNTRPMGIFGLRLKNNLNQEETTNFMQFNENKRPYGSNFTKLPAPYSSNKKISWLDIKDEDLFSYQLQQKSFFENSNYQKRKKELCLNWEQNSISCDVEK